MARSKEFEPTVVLEKAMWLFWQQGYTATSIHDLVKATGVQRYGLYGTFKDKHTLFLNTLDLYLENGVEAMVRNLDSEDANWETIVAFYDQFLAIADTPQSQFGCFMCNSAVELAVHDTAVAERMARYQARLNELFQPAITRAQAQGQLGTQLDAQGGANYLVGLTVGLMTYGKGPITKQAIADYLSIGLDGFKALTYQV